MVTITLIVVAGAWVVLSLFAGEMRRQHQELDLATQIAERKAARETAMANAAADLIARAGKSTPNRPASRSAR